jgi:uncharacterized protein YegL
MTQRRLPVYLLLDTSGSMRGEPIASVNVGLSSMLSALRQNPYALETVYLGLITFDLDAKEIFPLTPLDQVSLPQIQVPSSGPTFLGAALELLADRVDHEVIKSTSNLKGDWRPLVFILTDGRPSDLQTFRNMVPEIKKRNFGNIIACAAGPKADISILLELTEHVVHLDTTDSTMFAQFFKWVSASVSFGSSSSGVSDSTYLPPPPPEVQLVF